MSCCTALSLLEDFPNQAPTTLYLQYIPLRSLLQILTHYEIVQAVNKFGELLAKVRISRFQTASIC